MRRAWSAPGGDAAPNRAADCYSHLKVGLEVGSERRSMVLKVSRQVARSRCFIRGPERGRTGTLEADGAKAPGRPDVRDMLTAHVPLDLVGQLGLDLQPHFVDLCVAQNGGSF